MSYASHIEINKYFQIRYHHLQLCFIFICKYVSFLCVCINIAGFVLPLLTSAANCWHFGIWISATAVSAIRQNLCYKVFYLFLDTIAARISDLVTLCISVRKRGKVQHYLQSYFSNICIRVEKLHQRSIEDLTPYFQYGLNWIKNNKTPWKWVSSFKKPHLITTIILMAECKLGSATFEVVSFTDFF